MGARLDGWVINEKGRLLGDGPVLPGAQPQALPTAGTKWIFVGAGKNRNPSLPLEPGKGEP